MDEKDIIAEPTTCTPCAGSRARMLGSMTVHGGGKVQAPPHVTHSSAGSPIQMGPCTVRMRRASSMNGSNRCLALNHTCDLTRELQSIRYAGMDARIISSFLPPPLPRRPSTGPGVCAYVMREAMGGVLSGVLTHSGRQVACGWPARPASRGKSSGNTEA